MNRHIGLAVLLTLGIAGAQDVPKRLLTREPARLIKTIKTPKLYDPKGAFVIFEFEGSKGNLAVNGRTICRNQVRCMGEFPAGEYEIQLSQSGFLDSLFLIRVPRGANYYPTALRELPGMLTITAVDGKTGKPLVAKVYVEDREVGVTPWTGPVASDAKVVDVRAPGYRDGILTQRPPRRKTMSATAQLKRSSSKNMRKLASGCFEMGSKSGKKDEQPLHEVCISTFYMDQYEVTQEEFQKIMGVNPSFYGGCGAHCPVESVNWRQADAFCTKLGKRLPTEAEWEFAARAGSGSKWGCGIMSTCLNDAAWHSSNSKKSIHPVGKLLPNSWKLYDMQGNVAEWTADWYGHTYYAFSVKQDPVGANGGDSRVVRGGSFQDDGNYMLPSARAGFDPNFREPTVGFRCALDLPKP